MDIHEIKTLDFEDAVDMLENRLVDIRKLIEDNQKEVPSSELEVLVSEGAVAADQLAKLRQLKVSEMSGENDTLLTEVAELLDLIGKKVSDLFPNT